MASSDEAGLVNSRTVTQIGIVVRDIEAAARAYAEFLGVEAPAWAWTDAEDLARTKYRGASTPARAKLAFIPAGQVTIELIEPDEHPSTWREFLDEHGEGVHHIAFEVEGMAARTQALERREMPLVQKGEFPGGRYAYHDTAPQLKVVTELLEIDRS